MFRVFAAIAFLAQISIASAAEYGSRDEAVAMVKRVEDMFARAGADSTFKAVSDKSVATFHDRDLYPFIYDWRCVQMTCSNSPTTPRSNRKAPVPS